MHDSSSSQSLFSFTGSLAAHALLFLFLSHLQDQRPVSDQDTPLEVVFNDQAQPRFVEAPANQKKSQDKPEKEVEFKSNQTQRTDIETWKRPTRQTEMQANLQSGGQKGAPKKEVQKEKASETKSSDEPTFDAGDYMVSKNRKPLPLPGYGGGASRPLIPTSVQEKMPPGVRLGNITALNTDQHRYYSFNRRLLSRFVPLWGARVRQAVYQWVEQNDSPSVSKSWVTNVEVIMDPSGEIIDVQPFRLSGLWPIDNASIDSFKEIRKVPNPPSDMVDDNGYIHLQFQTEVLWIPRPGVRFHGNN